MTAFEYLAAFISIVAGLSVAQTLSGVARLIHGRRTMSADPVHLLWTASLLVWLIIFWWFSFSLSNVEAWSVGQLLFVLLYAALIYLLLALLYPSEMPSDFNARDHLESNRGWFFASLLALGVAELLDSLYKEGVGLLPGRPGGGIGGTTWYPIFMAVWIIGSAASSRWPNRRFDQFFCIVFFVLATAYLMSQGSLESIVSG